MAKQYDVAVLGATPAGLAAGCKLAEKGLATVVVSSPETPAECPLSDWASRDLLRMTALPKTAIKLCKANTFSSVKYYNSSLDTQIVHPSRSELGCMVQPSELSQALTVAARKAGAKVVSTTNPPTIELKEDCIRLLGSRQVQAKILIIAQGQPAAVLSDLAMPRRSVPRSPLVLAGLEIPIKSPKLERELAGSLHVLERKERTELGIFFCVGQWLHVRIISSSPAAGTRAAELSEMLADLQRAKVLPHDLPLGRAKGAVWHPPAGIALDFETHVTKRCLLAGTAGGFADIITGQTLAPTIRSALIAADVAAFALAGKNHQDTLMQFKTAWRKPLAERLRPPGTSLHMLLPLLFVNKRLAAQFTRTLLFGESI